MSLASNAVYSISYTIITGIIKCSDITEIEGRLNCSSEFKITLSTRALK
jgi:hypothetical protein